MWVIFPSSCLYLREPDGSPAVTGSRYHGVERRVEGRPRPFRLAVRILVIHYSHLCLFFPVGLSKPSYLSLVPRPGKSKALPYARILAL